MAESKRALRRWQAQYHMQTRLSQDRNQHYDDLSCACWTNKKFMAKFKEQPGHYPCGMCGNPRRNRWTSGPTRLTLQERKDHEYVQAALQELAL